MCDGALPQLSFPAWAEYIHIYIHIKSKKKRRYWRLRRHSYSTRRESGASTMLRVIIPSTRSAWHPSIIHMQVWQEKQNILQHTQKVPNKSAAFFKLSRDGLTNKIYSCRVSTSRTTTRKIKRCAHRPGKARGPKSKQGGHIDRWLRCGSNKCY